MPKAEEPDQVWLLEEWKDLGSDMSMLSYKRRLAEDLVSTTWINITSYQHLNQQADLGRHKQRTKI